MKGILLLAMAMVGVTSAISEEPGEANWEICYGENQWMMKNRPCCKQVRDIWKGKGGKKPPYPDCSPDGFFQAKTTGKASSPPITTTLPMTSKMTAKSTTATAMPSTTKLTTTSTIDSATNTPVEYVMVTSENGTFHASSTYKIKPGYAAEKAFGTAGYWCSIQDPPKPIRLWFQFNEPTCVTKIRFETPYKMTGEKGYEVFASDAVNDCGNNNTQTVLAKAPASVFVTGKEFENERFYRCYGIQTNHYGKRGYVSAKKLMFGIKGPVQKTDGKRTGPHFQ